MMKREGWQWPADNEDVQAAGRHRARRARRGMGGGGGFGGWGGGPPWGDGPPYSQSWPGILQGIFGRAQRVRRGDVRAAILVLLDEEPRNGYQLMQELERRSGGAWRPSSGSVYPTLQLLEDEGLVAAGKDESNRVYRLTERGKAYVAKHRDDLGTPWEVDAAVGDARMEVMQSLRELGPAIAQVVRFGTPEQVAEARRIVVDARRALYRILADDIDEDER